jgi:hypothetical protein
MRHKRLARLLGLPRVKRYEVSFYIFIITRYTDIKQHVRSTIEDVEWEGCKNSELMHPRVPRKKYSSACWMGFPNQFLYFPYQRKDGGGGGLINETSCARSELQNDPMHSCLYLHGQERREGAQRADPWGGGGIPSWMRTPHSKKFP